MIFYTDCFIPSINEVKKIKALKFGDYFELNSYLSDKNHESANSIFNKICSYSLEDVDLKNIDKFAILLQLRNDYINPILKLLAKDKDSNSVTYELLIKDIIERCKKYKINNFILPKELYYKKTKNILLEVDSDVENIKKHININKFLLFDVPDFIENIPKIYLNCFDNTLYYFCKLIYSTDLSVFYKKIKILKKDFNFLLSEIYEMNPKELDLFLKTK